MFFSLGAYFSINNIDVLRCFKRFFFSTILIYPVLVIIDLMTKNTEYNIYIHKIGILFGIVFFINIVSHFINKGILKENKFLAEASFFVFAMHEPYLTLIRKLLFKLTRPSSDVGIILLYIICPLTIIGITLSTYYIIKKNIPQVLIILTGRTMENKSIVTKFSQSKVS